MYDFIIFSLLILSWVAIFFCVFLLRHERKARKGFLEKFEAMELLHKNARQQNESLGKQLHELRAGSMGMSQKLVELSHCFGVLTEKHNTLEMNDADGRLYTRANKMVDLGADLHELMEECDLPKAEAELLLSIKKHRVVK